MTGEQENVPIRHVLVVDDEPIQCAMISAYLSAEKFKVYTANAISEARNILNIENIGLAIVDLRLAGEDGLTLVSEIKDRYGIGVIIVSGKEATIDKVVGLEMGADDYVTKPFENRELLARIRSVLRRSETNMTKESHVKELPDAVVFSGFIFDVIRRNLSAPNGQPIHLTTAEFDLLASFVKSDHKVIDRDSLYKALTGRENRDPLDRTVDVHVAKLRRKLELNPGQPDLIKTVRGAGYLFTSDVVPHSE